MGETSRYRSDGRFNYAWNKTKRLREKDWRWWPFRFNTMENVKKKLWNDFIYSLSLDRIIWDINCFPMFCSASMHDTRSYESFLLAFQRSNFKRDDFSFCPESLARNLAADSESLQRRILIICIIRFELAGSATRDTSKNLILVWLHFSIIYSSNAIAVP